LTGGQLTYGVPYGVLVDVLPPAARVRWRLLGRGRLRPSQRSHRILSRNLEFDSFSKSHSWAGYICFVLLREYSSISVTHGDSCNR
jgi:hypothetical protein